MWKLILDSMGFSVCESNYDHWTDIRQQWIVLEWGDYLGFTFLFAMYSVAFPCGLLVGLCAPCGEQPVAELWWRFWWALSFALCKNKTFFLRTAAGLTGVQWGAEVWPVQDTALCHFGRLLSPALSQVTALCPARTLLMHHGASVSCSATSLKLGFSSDVAAPDSDTIVA